MAVLLVEAGLEVAPAPVGCSSEKLAANKAAAADSCAALVLDFRS